MHNLYSHFWEPEILRLESPSWKQHEESTIHNVKKLLKRRNLDGGNRKYLEMAHSRFAYEIKSKLTILNPVG